jgi:hypothetical protein
MTTVFMLIETPLFAQDEEGPPWEVVATSPAEL